MNNTCSEQTRGKNALYDTKQIFIPRLHNRKQLKWHTMGNFKEQILPSDQAYHKLQVLQKRMDLKMRQSCSAVNATRWQKCTNCAFGTFETFVNS
jgi:hypothetical protein